MQVVFPTHRRVADCDQLVSDHQPTVSLRRTPIHNLSHIDAIVARYMLVAYSASNTEPKALSALQQLDLQQPDIARTAASSDILRQNRRIGVQQVSALAALTDLVTTSCNSVTFRIQILQHISLLSPQEWKHALSLLRPNIFQYRSS